MDRVNRAACALPAHDNTRKLPKGPSPMLDPDAQAFVADWLGHVEAGRIGGHLSGPAGSASGGAAQPLLEAPPVNEEARAIVLANERLLLGRRRSLPE